MREPLDVHVVMSYRPLLSALELTHVTYSVDAEAFGNEIDRYRNDHIFVDFVRDHRDETDYVQVIPTSYEEHQFDLTYLLEMLEPQLAPGSLSESVALLQQIISKVYAMFCSPHYVCYRRAYLSFENCKNLWDFKSARHHFEDRVK